MCDAMRWSVMAAVICLVGATAAQAQGLPGVATEVLLTELMIDTQESQAILYGNLLGVNPTSPQSLTGTSSMDLSAASFSLNLDPGSTYLGLPISDSVQCQFNPATGSYDWTASGSSALGVQWTETGNLIAAEVGQAIWTITSTQKVMVKLGDIKRPLYSVPDRVTIYGDPRDKWGAVSVRTSSLDLWDGNTGGTTIGRDRMGKNGNNQFKSLYNFDDIFKPQLIDPNVQPLSFQEVTSGTTPLVGGAGTYITTIGSVPEPSSWVMGTFGFLGLLGFTWWMRRAERAEVSAVVGA